MAYKQGMNTEPKFSCDCEDGCSRCEGLCECGEPVYRAGFCRGCYDGEPEELSEAEARDLDRIDDAYELFCEDRP